MNDFDPKTQKALEEFFARSGSITGRRVAVFDADGTLWRGDLGDTFFEHQVDKAMLKTAPGNAKDQYWDAIAEGRAEEAYGWLPKWCAGLREEDLLAEASRFFTGSFSRNVFPAMRRLVRQMLDAEIDVWVVTASPRWTIQAAMPMFGINPGHVIGSSVSVKDGILTDVTDVEVPYREKKADYIRDRIQTIPIFVSGNTFWDLPMMRLSSDTALGVCSEGPGGPNFEPEAKLQEFLRASKNTSEQGPVRWLSQRF